MGVWISGCLVALDDEKADGASQLDWPTRLKIAQGASCGLAYMHQICEPHIIVHYDIDQVWPATSSSMTIY